MGLAEIGYKGFYPSFQCTQNQKCLFDPQIKQYSCQKESNVMFRKDRIGRRGGGVILYVKESIQAYEIKLEREADCDEAVWCKIVSGNSKLTIGLVYRSPNINEEDNTKIKNAI